MDKKIQSKAAKLAGLSFAALLASASIASADEAAAVNVGGTKISLYGRLELNSSYDDGKTDGPWTTRAPSKAEDGRGRVYLGVGRTRLGFNLEGPQKEGEPKAFGKFESDFANKANGSTSNGVNPDAASQFRIRQSYGGVKFENVGLTLLFGQTEDVITPLDPPSVNPTSLNGVGNLGTRRPQIRLTQALGPVEIAAAATHDRGATSPSAPGVQGRLGLKVPAVWAGEKPFAFGVSGHYAKENEAYDKKEDYKKKGPSSHSLNADLSVPIVSDLTLSGEFFYGQNLKNYADASLNMTVKDANDENDVNDVRKDGIQSIGWWSALALKLPANLSAASGVGMESIDEKSKIAGKQENNMFIFANLAYNFTSVTKLTFEYMRISTDYANLAKEVNKELVFRDDKDGKVPSGSLNRYELNFRYDFK